MDCINAENVTHLYEIVEATYPLTCEAWQWLNYDIAFIRWSSSWIWGENDMTLINLGVVLLFSQLTMSEPSYVYETESVL